MGPSTHERGTTSAYTMVYDGNPEDEAALGHGDLVQSQSSSFASRSAAHALPWDRDQAQPGPGAYTPRMSSPRRRIAPSAAFANTTRRFAVEKSWDERDRIAGTALQSGARMDGGMGSSRGDRPRSAVFASRTARFEAEPNRSPELGQFDPASVVELRRTAPGRSAHGNPATSMASTSDRRLPFEKVASGPSPASYSPRRSEDLKPSRSSRLDLTAPRFRTESSHAGTPGPGAYYPVQAGRVGVGGRGANQGLPRATSERVLQFAPGESRLEIADTPGAGSYDPYDPQPRSVRGLSRSAAPGRSSAAFASRTERFASPRRSEAPTPGPGAYGGRRAAPLRRSASFGSSRRFQDAPKDLPGPGDYHPSADYHNGTPRAFNGSHGVESTHGTSAFASTTPRVELPSDVAAQTATARPGPGAHNTPLHQLRDSATKGRGARSSAFGSTARFRDESPRTPAPGAHNPAHKLTATQRYSSQPLL